MRRGDKCNPIELGRRDIRFETQSQFSKRYIKTLQNQKINNKKQKSVYVYDII